MNKDKRNLYLVTLLIFATLLAALFVKVESSKILTAILLIPLSLLTVLLVRKRKAPTIRAKEVILLVAVLGVLYVIIKEMTGLHFGFYKNPYFVNAAILLQYLLPTAIIIVATELIRYVILSQKSTLASVITFFSCVMAEVLTLSGIRGIINFNHFMDLVGLTFFPALCANIYYHYVSKHYGMVPNIVFRAITTLYIYFIPQVTDMSDSIASCVKIIFPIFMLAFVAAMFEKKKKNARRKGVKLGWIATLLTVCIIVGVAMLISCQFRFGALVIATESMTGEINKGDMIIYERYEGQPIEEGQVIVFTEYGSRIVHRVVRIEHIGDEIRYYTKGDANQYLDVGYRVESDIIGLTDLKVAFLGYPTLWLREIIQK